MGSGNSLDRHNVKDHKNEREPPCFDFPHPGAGGEVVDHPTKHHIDVRVDEQRGAQHENEPCRVVADVRRVLNACHTSHIADCLCYGQVSGGSIFRDRKIVPTPARMITQLYPFR